MIDAEISRLTNQRKEKRYHAHEGINQRQFENEHHYHYFSTHRRFFNCCGVGFKFIGICKIDGYLLHAW